MPATVSHFIFVKMGAIYPAVFIGPFTSRWKRTMIMIRAKAIVYPSMEMFRAVKPGPNSDEAAVHEPMRTVISGKRTIVRREIVIAVGPNRATGLPRPPVCTPLYSGMRMSENETPVDSNDDAQQGPIPPASFDYLVATFRFQAEMQLGLLHFGEEKDRPEPNLDLARHFIDLLAMLQGKTRGNLSLEEQRLLDNTVTELRFRFVQVAGDSVKA